MIGEAILSACYHVCPTDENFQFDTTFMYVISVLAIVKTYQFRHPDVTASAYKIFFGIALLLLLNVTGIFLNGTLFWIVGLIIYLYFLSHLFFVIYYHGKWRRPWQIKLVDNLVCILCTYIILSNEMWKINTFAKSILTSLAVRCDNKMKVNTKNNENRLLY